MNQEGKLVQLIATHRITHLLYAATVTGLIDSIGKTRSQLTVIADYLGLDIGLVRRVCRGLESLGFLQYIAPDVFDLTTLGECLLEQSTSTLRLEVLNAGAIELPAWARLPDSLRTGKPAFELAFNSPVYEYLAGHEHLGRIHDHALAAHSRELSFELAEHIGIDQYGLVVDLGGGLGDFCLRILEISPDVTSILFDCDRTIELARQALAGHPELGTRLLLQKGNFFQEAPSAADAYVLKWVLHNWSDQECVTILSALRDHCRGDSALVIYDWLVDPLTSSPTSAIQSDLTMMVFHQGRERSRLEVEAILGAGGFQINSVSTLPSGRQAVFAEPLVRTDGKLCFG